jgi:hypothetical protein
MGYSLICLRSPDPTRSSPRKSMESCLKTIANSYKYGRLMWTSSLIVQSFKKINLKVNQWLQEWHTEKKMNESLDIREVCHYPSAGGAFRLAILCGWIYVHTCVGQRSLRIFVSFPILQSWSFGHYSFVWIHSDPEYSWKTDGKG